MATTKISELPAASSVASSDVLPVVVGADTKKATVAVLALAMGITSPLGTAAFDDSADFDSAGAAAAAQAYAVQRANHTGTQSADTLTDGTTNKAFLATERTKLSGIATGATANSSDAALLARANHTGTQAFSTLTMATGRLIGRSTGGSGIAEEITIGSGLLLSGGVLSATAGGSGDVVGPASSTDNALARFDSTTGKLLQNSAVTVDDDGNIAAGGSVTADSITLAGSAVTVDNSGNITSTGNFSSGSGSLTADAGGNVAASATLAAPTANIGAGGVNVTDGNITTNQTFNGNGNGITWGDSDVMDGITPYWNGDGLLARSSAP